MECRFPKNSRSVLDDIWAKRRLMKSVSLTDQELARLKSTLGEMVC